MEDLSNDYPGDAPILTYITAKECEIICEVITKVQSKKVVEVGSYYGFSALFIAKALYEMKQIDKIARKIISIDIKDGAEKSIEKHLVFFRENEVLEFLVGDANFLLEQVIKGADTIFIDGNYHKEGLQSMWKVIEASSIKTIIMHDVMCKNVENAMWCNAFFQEKCKKYEKELFETRDINGHNNGVGVLYLK